LEACFANGIPIFSLQGSFGTGILYPLKTGLQGFYTNATKKLYGVTFNGGHTKFPLLCQLTKPHIPNRLIYKIISETLMTKFGPPEPKQKKKDDGDIPKNGRSYP
jgi:hypothetical protein